MRHHRLRARKEVVKAVFSLLEMEATVKAVEGDDVRSSSSASTDNNLSKRILDDEGTKRRAARKAAKRKEQKRERELGAQSISEKVGKLWLGVDGRQTIFR